MRDPRQREREDATRGRVARAAVPVPTTTEPQVCQTVAMPGTAYPTAPGVMYGVQPLKEEGVPLEGEAVVYANRSVPFLAAHVGTDVPPAGTKVLVFHGDRVGFCFEY